MHVDSNTTTNRTQEPIVMFSYLRWSSEKQTWGDSERRQAEGTERVCAQQGWTLSDRRFIDRGVSAWKGRNREDGALGELLKIVQPGQGIFLEAVDRWSREDPNDSIVALRKHIERGIGFYFASIGQLVNKDNYSQMRMILNMQAELACQHNERLSYRIREAMKAKRQEIEAGKLPFGRLPAWLEWSAPRKHADRKPVTVSEKVEVVRRIFKLCVEGHGVQFIEGAMQGTPPISNSKKSNWNKRFIHRLLTDRSVLGDYTATSTPGILPQIVDETTFLRAGEALKGRKNAHLSLSARAANSSLFTGLAYCIRCGHPLVRQQSISNGRKYHYMLCSGHTRKRANCPCGCAGLRYDCLEDSFLDVLKNSGLVRKLLSSERAESPLDSLKLKRADLQQRADNIQRAIEEGGEAKRLASRLLELEAAEREVQKEIDDQETKAKVEMPATEAYARYEAEFASVAKDITQRDRLRMAIRGFVDRVRVDLAGRRYYVDFRGATLGCPVMVTINSKTDWSFYPTPKFVLPKPPGEPMSFRSNVFTNPS
jgi:DNA invertase Pin-like site-specific DNA recombinase